MLRRIAGSNKKNFFLFCLLSFVTATVNVDEAKEVYLHSP